MDDASAEWVRALRGSGAERAGAEARLHELLVRIAFGEANRRGPASGVTGVELDDVAQQAADDAMLAVLRKLDEFRGESRFTTWAYRFVMFEVANRLARHRARHETVPLDAEEWGHLPSRFGDEDPLGAAQHRDLVAAVRRAVDDDLTDRQRRAFLAVVVNGVPMDAVAEMLGVTLNALYKTVFDARRKLRAALVARGYIEENTEGRS